MKNTKKIIVAMAALFITLSGGLQASNNSAQANAEYRNTRKLFAALGLKHTNNLVMEESQVALMHESEEEAQGEINSNLGDMIALKRLSVYQLNAIKNTIKEQPIRKDLKIKLTAENIGYGVYATNYMPAKTIVGVYSGKINSHDESNQDYAFPFDGIIVPDPLSNDSSGRWMPFNVDASIHGNATRFINHSHHENCTTFIMLDENKIPQIVFMTLDPIKNGEQLTINYGNTYSWVKKSTKAKVIISE